MGFKPSVKACAVAAVVVGAAVAISGAFLFMENREGSQVNEKALAELTEACQNLKAKDDYIIQNYMEAPDGNQPYLEVVHKGASYTEYPVDEETGAISSEDTGSYTCADWLTATGDYYYVDSSGKDGMTYQKCIDGYGKKLLSRNVGYADILLDGLTELRRVGNVDLDLGFGQATYLKYVGVVGHDALRDMLSSGTFQLYERMADDESTDKNVRDFCAGYVEDMKNTMTFSDGEIEILSNDGVLSQISIELGGLGTKMYVTKTFLTGIDYDVRETPDFTDATDFADELQEIADYVAENGGYEKAMEQLNEEAGSSAVDDTSVTDDSETSATDDNSEAEETTSAAADE